MAELPIREYQGKNIEATVKYAVVDDELLPLLQQHSWYMNRSYAVTRIQGSRKYLHYFVWEHYNGPGVRPDDEYLDHLNQDKLDNRIENLVFVNQIVKHANAPKLVNNTSGYKDVGRSGEKFRAMIRFDYKGYHLGQYSTAVEAAYAVNIGYLKFHPEVPSPNAGVESLLSPEQKRSVEANVVRLISRNRPPT